MAPYTYALTSVIAFHKRQAEAAASGGGDAAGDAAASAPGDTAGEAAAGQVKLEGETGEGGVSDGAALAATGAAAAAGGSPRQPPAAARVEVVKAEGERQQQQQPHEEEEEEEEEEEDESDEARCSFVFWGGGWDTRVHRHLLPLRCLPPAPTPSTCRAPPSVTAPPRPAPATPGSLPQEREEERQGEEWVAALQTRSYDQLTLPQRVALLSALCHLAMDAPSVRAILELRLEEQSRIKRLLAGGEGRGKPCAARAAGGTAAATAAAAAPAAAGKRPR